jgi:hypothetical protein
MNFDDGEAFGAHSLALPQAVFVLLNKSDSRRYEDEEKQDEEDESVKRSTERKTIL